MNNVSHKEIRIPVPWGHIQGRWWGPESEEPILFLHGWQDNLGTFDKLVPLLANNLSILCIDFPGHGLSSHYPKGQFYYLFWDGLIVVRRIVKYFSWQKISIVGHSLGGAVGFLYAASFPDEVDKLVMIDIACPRVSKPSTLAKQCGGCIDRFLKYENLPLSSQPFYAYEEMKNIAFDGYKGSVTKESIDTLLVRGMKPTQAQEESKYYFSRDVRLKIAGLGMPSLDIVLEFASQITCHYLNIRALQGLKLETPEIYPMVMDRLKKTTKSFQYVEVTGTHHVHLNDPQKISNCLSEFLNTDQETLELNGAVVV